MAVSNNNQHQWHQSNSDSHELLHRELDEAHRTIRALMRRLAEEQEQQRKTHHAYETKHHRNQPRASHGRA